VLNKVLIQTLMPSQSLKAHEQDWKGFYSAYKKRLSLLALISVGVYLLLLFVGKPVLAYIFSFKNFTTDNVNLLWSLMIMLFGVWFGGLMGSLTSGTFYAKGDTKTPTLMSAILFTVYVPVKIYCFMRFGITGLALSTSIYMMISLFIQMFLINRSGNKVLKNAFAE
jgi:peptidoglycan biosynthesis protein MviN/MurJ (putative lipid II flippase)